MFKNIKFDPLLNLIFLCENVNVLLSILELNVKLCAKSPGLCVIQTPFLKFVTAKRQTNKDTITFSRSRIAFITMLSPCHLKATKFNVDSDLAG